MTNMHDRRPFSTLFTRHQGSASFSPQTRAPDAAFEDHLIDLLGAVATMRLVSHFDSPRRRLPDRPPPRSCGSLAKSLLPERRGSRPTLANRRPPIASVPENRRHFPRTPRMSNNCGTSGPISPDH